MLVLLTFGGGGGGGVECKIESLQILDLWRLAGMLILVALHKETSLHSAVQTPVS